MNKPNSTPVAAIILIIVLGVVVIGGLVGGLLFGARLFFYQSHQREVARFEEIQHELELGLEPTPAEDPYETHYQAASLAHATGNLQRALDEFTAAIEANPDAFAAYLTRGVVHQQLGDWQSALDDYRIARELNPDDYGSYNNIAMLLAACPDDSMRDGDKAAEYALKACKLTDWKHPAVVNTLAIAYAEQGEWKYAVDHANLAINNASTMEGSESMIEGFRSVLKLFEDEMPYRIATPKAE